MVLCNMECFGLQKQVDVVSQKNRRMFFYRHIYGCPVTNTQMDVLLQTGR